MLKNLIKFANPIHLIFAGLAYFFGLSVSVYLGNSIDIGLTWLAAFWVLLLMILNGWLAVYFDPLSAKINDISETEFLELKPVLFNGALVFITLLFALIVPIYFASQLSPLLSAYLSCSFLLVLFLNIPPISLVKRGFADLIQAILIGFCFPSLAYILHQNGLHRILPMLATPITFLILAFFISQNFQHFARDQKYARQTSLTRMGWENSILLHNAFLLIAYFLLALSGLLGVPFRLIWPALLTLPLAIYQIYMFRRIADGANPSWTMIRWVGFGIVAITLYLMTYALLIN